MSGSDAALALFAVLIVLLGITASTLLLSVRIDSLTQIVEQFTQPPERNNDA